MPRKTLAGDAASYVTDSRPGPAETVEQRDHADAVYAAVAELTDPELRESRAITLALLSESRRGERAIEAVAARFRVTSAVIDWHMRRVGKRIMRRRPSLALGWRSVFVGIDLERCEGRRAARAGESIRLLAWIGAACIAVVAGVRIWDGDVETGLDRSVAVNTPDSSWLTPDAEEQDEVRQQHARRWPAWTTAAASSAVASEPRLEVARPDGAPNATLLLSEGDWIRGHYLDRTRNEIIAANYSRRTIEVLNLPSGRIYTSRPFAHVGSVVPAGGFLWALEPSGQLYRIDSATLAPIGAPVLCGDPGGAWLTNALTCDAQDRLHVCRGADGRVLVVHAVTGERLFEWQLPSGVLQMASCSDVIVAAINQPGTSELAVYAVPRELESPMLIATTGPMAGSCGGVQLLDDGSILAQFEDLGVMWWKPTDSDVQREWRVAQAFPTKGLLALDRRTGDDRFWYDAASDRLTLSYFSDGHGFLLIERPVWVSDAAALSALRRPTLSAVDAVRR